MIARDQDTLYTDCVDKMRRICLTGGPRHTGLHTIVPCTHQSADQGAIDGIVVNVKEHSGKQPRPLFGCEDLRKGVVLIVGVQLAAGCHNRFFPGEIGCNFRRIRLSVFNRL